MGERMGIVLGVITCVDMAEAERIGRALVEARLVACAQFQPHRSIYRWQGQVEQADEVRLFVKTTQARWPEVMALARTLHSYELPAILALDVVDALPEFRDWIISETS